MIAKRAVPLVVGLLASACAQLLHAQTPVQMVRGPENHLLVPATINGHAAGLLLDTASEISFLQQDRAQQFGLDATGGKLKAGETLFPAAAIDNFTCGPSAFGRVEFALFDPKQFRGPVPGKGGKAADGIIGLDLLRRFGAVINCRTQQLYFRTKGSGSANLDATARAQGLTRVRLEPTPHGFISVPCTIGTRAGALYLDTGAFVTVFDRASASMLQLQAAPSKLRARTTGGRVAALELARVEQFKIGGVPIEPQRFAVMDLFPDRKALRTYTPGIVKRIEFYDARAWKSRLDVWGLLGSELLYLHSAIIDLDQMAIYLK
ncbi:MAG: aspartyl protease family protein [Chthoniobacterales bacterium]